MFLALMISKMCCHAMPQARVARWQRRGQAMAKWLWKWGPLETPGTPKQGSPSHSAPLPRDPRD